MHQRNTMAAALPQGNVYKVFVHLLKEEEPIFLCQLFTLLVLKVLERSSIKSKVAGGDYSSQDRLQLAKLEQPGSDINSDTDNK